MFDPIDANDQSAHAGAELTDLDRGIIVATQEGLPLVSEPFALIAKQLGVSPEMVQERMAGMMATGVIRRIAAVPNHYAVGYSCNGMSVWDVDDTRIEGLGPKVGALEFVSHSYRRPRRQPEWPYNLFAMVHGKTEQEVLERVESIAEILGDSVGQHDVLFSKRILKKTGLRLRPANRNRQGSA